MEGKFGANCGRKYYKNIDKQYTLVFKGAYSQKNLFVGV